MAWFRRDPELLPKGEQESRVPEGLWLKCTECKEIIYRKEVVANQSICTKCSFHFRISAKERLDLLCDPGWQEFDAGLVSTDPLDFKDTKPYKARLEDSRRRTGVNDALVSAAGAI